MKAYCQKQFHATELKTHTQEQDAWQKCQEDLFVVGVRDGDFSRHRLRAESQPFQCNWPFVGGGGSCTELGSQILEHFVSPKKVQLW